MIYTKADARSFLENRCGFYKVRNGLVWLDPRDYPRSGYIGKIKRGYHADCFVLTVFSETQDAHSDYLIYEHIVDQLRAKKAFICDGWIAAKTFHIVFMTPRQAIKLRNTLKKAGITNQ